MSIISSADSTVLHFAVKVRPHDTVIHSIIYLPDTSVCCGFFCTEASNSNTALAMSPFCNLSKPSVNGSGWSWRGLSSSNLYFFTPHHIRNLKSLASAVAEILKGKPQISRSSPSPGPHHTTSHQEFPYTVSYYINTVHQRYYYYYYYYFLPSVNIN